MASRHWLYFCGFVIAGILLIGAVLMGIVDALSVLSGGTNYGEEFLLLAMLGEAAEWVMAGVLLGLLAAVFLVATVVSVLRNASLPRSDRLVPLVEWLERRYPVLRRFGASKRVEPSTADRRQRVKEQYVAGEIGEGEFEREMERLLDDESADERPRSESATRIDVDDRSR